MQFAGIPSIRDNKDLQTYDLRLDHAASVPTKIAINNRHPPPPPPQLITAAAVTTIIAEPIQSAQLVHNLTIVGAGAELQRSRATAAAAAAATRRTCLAVREVSVSGDMRACAHSSPQVPRDGDHRAPPRGAQYRFLLFG